MAIAQQEVFAPVMTVMKYDTVLEAISIANGTRYGLGASVFGRNQADCRFVAQRVSLSLPYSTSFSHLSDDSSRLEWFAPMISEVRLVVHFSRNKVDDISAVFYLNQSLPFGGTASSGYGRFAGAEGLRGLCNLKAITEDRFHGSLQTSIPPLLAYPISNGEAAWTFVQGLVRMAFAGSMRERGKGLWDLVMAKE